MWGVYWIQWCTSILDWQWHFHWHKILNNYSNINFVIIKNISRKKKFYLGYNYTKENANLTSGKIGVTINITTYAFNHIDAKNDVIEHKMLGVNKWYNVIIALYL